MITGTNSVDDAFLLALPSMRYHADNGISPEEAIAQAAIIHGFLDFCAIHAGQGTLRSSADETQTETVIVDIGGDGPIKK